ncbi:hypothetical protein VTK56DRAFT_2582 [Thermocarpiscus australiensis]
MYLPKLLSVFSLLTAASAVQVTHDSGYDDPQRSLTAVACSDGTNGVMWKYNWKVQGDVKDFPYIGGSDAIAGWNSPNCGTCWSVSYQGKTIHVLAIDHAGSGLNIGTTAMNELTGGRAEELGHIDATVAQVPLTECGL